jgi:hypothetical protein
MDIQFNLKSGGIFFIPQLLLLICKRESREWRKIANQLQKASKDEEILSSDSRAIN